jgi:hypothetical protein
MASIVYNSFYNNVFTGAIDVDTDSFKIMLTTSSYTPSKSHSKRSDITNEVTGAGYTTGGNACALTVVAVDNVNNRQEISASVTSWTSSTITARYGIIYKNRGGLASADELVGCLDFTTDQSSSGGTFAITVSTNLRVQN